VSINRKYREQARTFQRDRGFTLIELLTVIAIIVILGAILLPVLNVGRKSSLRGKSKAQFSQWVIAVEGFRQEYGFYPFLSGSGDTIFPINEGSNRDLFEQVLAGEETDYNRRAIRFYTLTNDELVDPATPGSPLQDAFGNTALHLLIDGDRDGRIQVDGYDIRGSVEVIALENELLGYPMICTWDEN